MCHIDTRAGLSGRGTYPYACLQSANNGTGAGLHTVLAEFHAEIPSGPLERGTPCRKGGRKAVRA